MYNFLLMAHSGWRYIVLLLLAVAIVKFLIGWLGKGNWSSLDRRIGLFTTISVDIQFVLGLALWGVAASLGLIEGRVVRMMEHPVIMLIAIVIMHIGWSRARKATGDQAKFQTAAIAFVVTGLLVALGVARVTGVM